MIKFALAETAQKLEATAAFSPIAKPCLRNWASLCSRTGY